jgi:hypothetical protein
VQAHHADLGYYHKFYKDGVVEQQDKHDHIWHAGGH